MARQETVDYWEERALAAEARLAQFEKLFTDVSFGADHEAKRQKEDLEDRIAGVFEVPNQNPLPVDPFFHVG